MKLSDTDYRCLIALLMAAEDAKEAKAALQMWFNEKIAPVQKETWLECCEYNDVKYDGFLDD